MLEVSSQWGLRLTFGLDGAGWASRRLGGETMARTAVYTHIMVIASSDTVCWLYSGDEPVRWLA